MEKVARFEARAMVLTKELDAWRQWRISRWLDRLRLLRDPGGRIAPAFQPLMDSSVRYLPDSNEFTCGPSCNLQQVPFVAYPLEPRRRNLCAVRLAPILDFPMSEGRLGVELISSANQIVAQGVVPLADVDDSVPTVVSFLPVADSDRGRLWLRVFVRDAAYPVRLLEWRRHRFRGLGRLQTRAFCQLVFDDGSATE